MTRSPAVLRRPPGDPLARGRRMITGFTPPEGVPIAFEVAPLGSRGLAQLADILITLAALIMIMAVLYFSNMLPLSAVIGIGAILFFAIRVPYYTLSELLMNGQTLGKRLAGMRVIASDGRSLSPHAVTVRNLMKEMEIFVPGTLLLVASTLDTAMIVGLLAWIAILLTVPLANRNRQRLGDILAGTYVVMLPRPVLLPELTRGADEAGDAFRFMPHHLDHYGRFELQTLEALLQVPVETLNRHAARQHGENLLKVSQTIADRIGYEKRIEPREAHAFLLAFYRTQRAYLENRKLFGDTREDKFYRDRGADTPEA